MGSSASVANICTMSSPPPPRTTSFISPPEMYNPQQKEMVRLRFSAKNLADLDFFSKSDPFLELSRPARQGYNFTTVRKTETINNNLNPNWKVLYIPLTELCDRDFDMKLKIDVYDEDNTTVELIGEVCLSLNDLLSMAASQTPAQLFEVNRRDKSRGDLYVKECIVENYSHLPSQPDDRKASMTSVMSQQVDRRTSMMSQSGNLADENRRISLMSQSGELVTPYSQLPANLNYSNQVFSGGPLNNNPAIPPPATYTNPAASQGYPPFHPGYTASHIPSSNPGLPPAGGPSGDLGDSPRYPPSHQQFQPPNFPGQSPAYHTSGQPPVFAIPVPSHDQHYIPNYNIHPGGPPGPTYQTPPGPTYPIPPGSTNQIPPDSTNQIPPGSTNPNKSNSLYPQLP